MGIWMNYLKMKREEHGVRNTIGRKVG